MTTRSGFADGCVDVVLQMPMTASTLGLSESMRFVGRPLVGKSESLSTACTWGPAPIAKSVSVAVGDSDTTHCAAPAALAAELSRGRATTLSESARTNRMDLNMDISFPSKWVGRRTDIRTTAPYLESCLSHLLAEGDLATWSNFYDTYSCGTALESHQLRCREALSTLLHSPDDAPGTN